MRGLPWRLLKPMFILSFVVWFSANSVFAIGQRNDLWTNRSFVAEGARCANVLKAVDSAIVDGTWPPKNNGISLLDRLALGKDLPAPNEPLRPSAELATSSIYNFFVFLARRTIYLKRRARYGIANAVYRQAHRQSDRTTRFFEKVRRAVNAEASDRAFTPVELTFDHKNNQRLVSTSMINLGQKQYVAVGIFEEIGRDDGSAQETQRTIYLPNDDKIARIWGLNRSEPLYAPFALEGAEARNIRIGHVLRAEQAFNTVFAWYPGGMLYDDVDEMRKPPLGMKFVNWVRKLRGKKPMPWEEYNQKFVVQRMQTLPHALELIDLDLDEDPETPVVYADVIEISEPGKIRKDVVLVLVESDEIEIEISHEARTIGLQVNYDQRSRHLYPVEK